MGPSTDLCGPQNWFRWKHSLIVHFDSSSEHLKLMGRQCEGTITLPVRCCATNATLIKLQI